MVVSSFSFHVSLASHLTSSMAISSGITFFFFPSSTSPSSSHFTNLGGRANITGVGFFDISHGQIGVAPNAIELNPVLKFLASSCSH